MKNKQFQHERRRFINVKTAGSVQCAFNINIFILHFVFLFSETESYENN